ncbi:hypothetical protein [Natronorubrum sp. FCH18a]|uniref:hypothetical protein n=1 Tax=Natronorubrum sp. FCH18a TaxID=3447018 RepID=UPI003F51945F
MYIEGRTSDQWQKLQTGELDEDPDPELVDAVEDRLREEGVLAGGSDATEQVDLSGAVSPPSASTTGSVSVEDVMEVREKLELLLEQAEYTDDQRAEFVAKKGIEWIDGLVESAIVTTETIYTLIAQPLCDQVCIDFQWLL